MRGAEGRRLLLIQIGHHSAVWACHACASVNEASCRTRLPDSDEDGLGFRSTC